MTLAGRVTASILRLFGVAFPRIDYLKLYRARVSGQSADLTKVDVIPDNADIPGLSAVPLYHGLPGFKTQLQLSPPPYVIIGFLEGDPSKPYVHGWEGGESCTKLILEATTVYVGGEAGAEELVKKSEVANHVHDGSTLLCSGGTVSGSTGTLAGVVGTSNVKGK